MAAVHSGYKSLRHLRLGNLDLQHGLFSEEEVLREDEKHWSF